MLDVSASGYGYPMLINAMLETIETGVDLVVIQERLGHESITTTVGTYGHLRIDADANAADALD